MLHEHPGEVVTREELQKKLWPAGTFVDFDHWLNKAIGKIREALSDTAESLGFVITAARRGYRFLADVLYAALVSIIKLENLGTKARMRLIPGEEFFSVRQFGALRGHITIFEEFSIVASSGPWLLE
jgi:DNA-binding winged helix-turn-helix (wHTH) protein